MDGAFPEYFSSDAIFVCTIISLALNRKDECDNNIE